MSYRIVIKPLAEKDIVELYTWYNQEKEGLGDDFLTELERSLEFIKANPYQYQIRYKGVRMTKINSFPICLHHTVQEEVVFVHAVLSTHRNPRIWEKRN
jgi:toxin ParE1/3/4